MDTLTNFLNTSLSPYHACENMRKALLSHGFKQLLETQDWELAEGGKYFVERAGGAVIAFTVGGLDNFSYKIVASHVDSPALKLKENPVEKKNGCATLNVETYGGGIWHTFFDRPLKIAGRVVKSENGRVYSENVQSPFLLTIPSLAIHQNRGVNEGFAPNPQIDLQPLLALQGAEEDWLKQIAGEETVLSHDLFLVSAQAPYFFGAKEEFLASPRLDDLTSVCATLNGLFACAESDGICVAAFLNSEEIGNRTTTGADGDFLGVTLHRIAYALRFDDNEYFKAVCSSFFLSVDNAHAVHPNHPEKADTTNKAVLGGGVVIKAHANGAYITNAMSSAVVKTILDKAGVKHQNFFNRSDVRSGSTLGAAALSKLGMAGVDLGLAQLAMHSACECMAKSDYAEMVTALTAFYSTNILAEENGFVLQ